MSDRLLGIAELQLSPIAQWLALNAPKGPVLDVSTPPGVVARTLAERGHDVVCVSPRSAVVEVLAGELGSRVEIKQGDLTGLPLPSGSIGSVVAAEPPLEGVPLDSALDEFARVIADGGLLVAAPGRSSGVQITRGVSPEVRKLREALSSRFENVAVVHQSFWMLASFSHGSLAVDLPPSGAEEECVHGVSLVLASDSPLPLVEGSFITMQPPEVRRWIQEWHRMLADVRTAQARAESYAKGPAERDLLLQELFISEQSLADSYDSSKLRADVVSRAGALRAELIESRAQLRRAKERIAFLEKASADAHDYIQKLQTSTSWRVTEPLRLLKGLSSRRP